VEDSRLVAPALARGQRRLVASPDYLARHGRPDSLAAWPAPRHLHLNRGIADWRFEDVRQDDFVRPPAALRVNNGDMMRDAALAGLGMAMLPSFIVGQDIRAGTLVKLDIGLKRRRSDLRGPSRRTRALAKLRTLVSTCASTRHAAIWDGTRHLGL
jgi:DNA-binding transcriptional LysR family regulator